MNHFQRRTALTICLFVSCAVGGCAPAARHKQAIKPIAKNELAETAADAAGRYAGRLSAACRDTAGRATELKSWAGVYDAFHDSSLKARSDSFAAFEDAITARLKGGETPYDPAAVTQVFSDAADGFERASKTMSAGGGK